MKRIYAAVIGAVVIAACIVVGWSAMEQRNQVSETGPLYAYVDLEHVVMSHPRYSEYHRLELEYNAMVAQYQFEQWNYSHKAAAEGLASQQFAAVDAAGTAALNQELQAKVLLKEQELNNGLKQQYDKILQEKRKSQPMISNADSLKIVNLQLKLQNLVLSQEERQAAEAELAQLLKSAEPSVVISGETAAEIDKEMAPYREKAQKELEEYAKTVKGDLEKCRDDSRSAFQSQLSALQDRPEPEEWNRQWKEKLQAKEKKMKDVKEAILADIRTRAADVAHEQGIEMIFCEYAGVGTARDVTDDIIARLG